jgi:hypothetical protein
MQSPADVRCLERKQSKIRYNDNDRDSGGIGPIGIIQPDTLDRPPGSTKHEAGGGFRIAVSHDDAIQNTRYSFFDNISHRPKQQST